MLTKHTHNFINQNRFFSVMIRVTLLYNFGLVTYLTFLILYSLFYAKQ